MSDPRRAPPGLVLVGSDGTAGSRGPSPEAAVQVGVAADHRHPSHSVGERRYLVLGMHVRSAAPARGGVCRAASSNPPDLREAGHTPRAEDL